MEYAKDEIFNIRYNTKMDRLQIGHKTLKDRIFESIRQHKLITTVVAAFLIFSCINVAMIWSFMNILQNL